MRRIATALGVAALFCALLPAAGQAASFGSSGAFGGTGSADGQLNAPQGAATDPSGNLYVADTGNRRVEKFDDTGKFVSSLTPSPDFSPQDIAIGPAGNVYVASPTQVDVWNALGVHLGSWPTTGTSSYGIAVDGAGNVYVSDTQTSVITEYSSLGTKLGTVAGADSGAGQPLHPKGMTIDSAGNLWVADPSDARIEKFDSSGNFKGQVSMPHYLINANGNTYTGDLDPRDVAVDDSGRIFAPDAGTHSNLVAVFDSNSTQVFGSPDSDPSNPCQVRAPQGVATSPPGTPASPSGTTLYVVSTGENMIRTFDESSTACPSPNFGVGGSVGGGGSPTAAPGPSGPDTTRPSVSLSGFPRKCARRNFAFLVHLEDNVSLARMQLIVQQRPAANEEINKPTFDFRVNIPVRRVRRQLPHGFVLRVAVAVRATDTSGNRAVANHTFRICG